MSIAQSQNAQGIDSQIAVSPCHLSPGCIHKEQIFTQLIFLRPCQFVQSIDTVERRLIKFLSSLTTQPVSEAQFKWLLEGDI